MTLETTDIQRAIDAILVRMGLSRQELEARAIAEDSFAWSARVHQSPNRDDHWHWDFRYDFPAFFPTWLVQDIPVDRVAAMPRARLTEDIRRCQDNSHTALAKGNSGYTQAFRYRQPDGNLLWIKEEVIMEKVSEGSFFLVGLCSRADQNIIDETLEAIRVAAEEATGRSSVDPTLNDPDILRRRLDSMQRDIDMLAKSGQWLIWSCIVRQVRAAPAQYNWTFRDDFVRLLPEWFDLERVEGEDLAVTLSRARVAEDDRACFSTAGRALESSASGYRQVFRVRLRDNRTSWVEENVSILKLGQDEWYLVGVCIDATDRKVAEEALQNAQAELVAQNEELQGLRETLEAEKAALAIANERLANLASTDGLTGVKNHRAFREQLEAEFNTSLRYGSPLSLILLDVDHFKRLNDVHGHPAGDAVLANVGRLLTDNARSGDLVARVGGEEFAVILPHTDSPGGAAMGERFRSMLEAHEWLHGQVTASFGVASLDPSCFTSEMLIDRADQALYQAKASGRNCVMVAPAPDVPGGNLASSPMNAQE